MITHIPFYADLLGLPLFEDKKATHSHVLVYGAIELVSNPKPQVFPSNGELADLIGYKKSTVKTVLSELSRAGWVRVTKASNGREVIGLVTTNPPLVTTNPPLVTTNPSPELQESAIKRKEKKSNQKKRKEKNTSNKLYVNSNIKSNTHTCCINNRRTQKEHEHGLTDKDFEDIARKYYTSYDFVQSKYESLLLWCEAKGNSYKNYKAALRNWVKKDFDAGKVPFRFDRYTYNYLLAYYEFPHFSHEECAEFGRKAVNMLVQEDQKLKEDYRVKPDADFLSNRRGVTPRWLLNAKSYSKDTTI